MTDYTRGYNACNRNWRERIKAKIEEVENQKERYIDIIDDYNAQICDCIIEEYESLLEKE